MCDCHLRCQWETGDEYWFIFRCLLNNGILLINHAILSLHIYHVQQFMLPLVTKQLELHRKQTFCQTISIHYNEQKTMAVVMELTVM